MLKQVRMTWEEVLEAGKKEIALIPDFESEDFDYGELIGKLARAYSKNLNQNPEFALVVAGKDLQQFYENKAIQDNLDPATQIDIARYGYMGVLHFTYKGPVGGKDFICFVYTPVLRNITSGNPSFVKSSQLLMATETIIDA